MFSFVFFIQIIVLAKLDSIKALTRASLGSYFVEQMGDFSCKVLVTSVRSKRFGWQAPEKATYGNLTEICLFYFDILLFHWLVVYKEMLTSMQAFELIENNYSCRKSADRPVYKLSVVIKS